MAVEIAVRLDKRYGWQAAALSRTALGVVVEVGGILESHLPRIGSAIVRGRGQGRSAAFVAAGIGFAAEIEHVEQIADGRAVHWDIGIVSVWMRVRQIIAAAAG